MYRVYHESQGFNWLKSWRIYLDIRYTAKRNTRMLSKLNLKYISLLIYF